MIYAREPFALILSRHCRLLLMMLSSFRRAPSLGVYAEPRHFDAGLLRRHYAAITPFRDAIFYAAISAIIAIGLRLSSRHYHFHFGAFAFARQRLPPLPLTLTPRRCPCRRRHCRLFSILPIHYGFRRRRHATLRRIFHFAAAAISMPRRLHCFD
jgi:hypothetical protein